MRPQAQGDYRWIYSTALVTGMTLFKEGSSSKVEYIRTRKDRTGLCTEVHCADGARLYLYPKDRIAILLQGIEEVKEDTRCKESWLQRQLRF